MTTLTTRRDAAGLPPATAPDTGSRFARWRSSWRISLTMARRDAVRYRGRSALIVVMVALPVALIVAGLTFSATSNTSLRESLPTRLGNAQAAIDSISSTVVNQGPDGSYSMGGGPGTEEKARPIPGFTEYSPLADRVAALAALTHATIVPIQYGDFRWQDGARRPSGTAAYVDPTVDLGPKLRLNSGRWPTSTAEVAVTPAGIAQGMPTSGPIAVRVGDTDIPVTVVGQASLRDPNIGMPLLLTTAPWDAQHAWQTQYILQRDTPVLWPEVRELNRYGLGVTSRAVVENPPAPSELSPDARMNTSNEDASTRLAAAILGSTLFLITALLVGPAFAVSAGRQRRSLALAASNGAETRQLRRSVLASAVVLGVLAVALGAALGAAVALGAAAYWRWSHPWTTFVGPNDIPWIAVLIVAACATLAALTAALIPALRLGRLDIVGVMKGQNVSPPHNRRLPWIGLVLFAVGGAGVFLAVVKESALAAVVGMVGLLVGPLLIIPVLLVWVGRIAARFPVTVRMATRDAARQRHRSAPTVAAVMAGSALLSTFAVFLASDTKFQARQYVPSTIAGEGVAFLGDKQSRDEFAAAVASFAPTWKMVQEYAVQADYGPDGTATPTEEPFVGILPDGCTPSQIMADDGSGMDPGSNPCWAASTKNGQRASVTVIPAEEIIRRLRLTGADAAAIRAGAVVVGDARWAGDRGVVLAYGARSLPTDTGEVNQPPTQKVVWSKTITIPTVLASAADYRRGAVDNYTGLVIPEERATALGIKVSPSQVHIYDPAGPISKDAEKKVTDRLSDSVHLSVERGFQRQDFMILAIVFGIAAFLLVTVTLISTALALAEQQSDMGTLAAVGATKGTRRSFAGAQAATVGAVGVGLGILVGIVAGVSLAYPATSQGWDQISGQQVTLSPTIGIPALHLMLVLVGVPLLAALIAAGSIRRSPTVTRRA
ncbi:MAG: hypothetical protein IPH03_16980 [Tetrasphaera sp.]|nr:hypothetical protein [Tetrasphaera sp.]